MNTASIADAGAGNINGFKTPFANGLSIIKGNPIFSNGPKSLLKNPPDSLIWCSWGFDNFILVNEP